MQNKKLKLLMEIKGELKFLFDSRTNLSSPMHLNRGILRMMWKLLCLKQMHKFGPKIIELSLIHTIGIIVTFCKKSTPIFPDKRIEAIIVFCDVFSITILPTNPSSKQTNFNTNQGVRILKDRETLNKFLIFFIYKFI